MKDEPKSSENKRSTCGIEVLRALRRVVGAGAGRGNGVLRQVPGESGGLAGSEEEIGQAYSSGASTHGGREDEREVEEEEVADLKTPDLDASDWDARLGCFGLGYSGL